ncbi:MAG TPA: DUF1828 domain-containing protein [Polyangiaceae bacterium]|nr:DUF1828 domain-containing protein [Polyangiaceae bacterium]
MTTCEDFRRVVIEGVPQVLRCDETSAGLRLRTVFEHPDGDLIDIFLVQADGRVLLTDYGEALRHLDVLGFDAMNTPKKRAMFNAAIANLNVQESEGRLEVSASADDPKDLATKIFRLGQAAVRVGDLIFLARELSPRFFRDDVREFLAEHKFPIEDSPQVLGRSGQGYTLDFRIRRKTRPLIVKTMTTGSRAAAETMVSSTVRMFYDLARTSGFDEQPVAVFDDSEDVWSPSQFELVGSLAPCVLWSHPDELVRLAAA